VIFEIHPFDIINRKTMQINADTKIAAILKEKPAALNAIISINSKFEKLRNPFLRKLMAARTSIGMASKISGSSLEDFYAKLEPLGFEIDKTIVHHIKTEKQPPPVFFKTINSKQVIEFDVRPIINSGEDPLRSIVKKVKEISKGQVLKIINSFEPTPLILLLKKQGFESYVDLVNEQLVETYFYKKDNTKVEINEPTSAASDWDHYVQKFNNKTKTIDVRELEMPQPMLTILDSLDHLSPENALFVFHKRIPVFLLPELKNRDFDFRIKEINDNEVHLLIFKPDV
jgi:uncharacterized protein (DUF2249 family)